MTPQNWFAHKSRPFSNCYNTHSIDALLHALFMLQEVPGDVPGCQAGSTHVSKLATVQKMRLVASLHTSGMWFPHQTMRKRLLSIIWMKKTKSGCSITARSVVHLCCHKLCIVWGMTLVSRHPAHHDLQSSVVHTKLTVGLTWHSCMCPCATLFQVTVILFQSQSDCHSCSMMHTLQVQ